MRLPACAGCGSAYKPRHKDDAACSECVKWNMDTPRKYLQAGFREKHNAEWAERWNGYWQQEAAA